jgi:hypothetical protein
MSSFRAFPPGVVAVTACALAWRGEGSIAAADWLPAAILVLLVLAVSLGSGRAVAPPRLPLVAAALLVLFAAWTAVSLAWSPVPSLARDEALLVVSYVAAFLVPLVTLRSRPDREAAALLVLVPLAILAVATATRVWLDAHPEELYWAGRLSFPLSYPNAEAAIFLLGFWPALALAADRAKHAAVRAGALGLAVAALCGWLMAQSKGGAIGLACSAVLVFALCRSRLRLLVPTLAASLLTLAGAERLTAAYRADSADLASTASDAGATLLVLAGLGVVVGAIYALADQRVSVSARVKRLAGGVALAALAAVLLGGTVAFAASADRLDDKWQSFKHRPQGSQGSTHLTSLGSNRYDFWRVSLDEFRAHPVAGIGARGFAAAYLREGRSEETPQRAHSLELDVLPETGIVGMLLLGGALIAALAAVVGRARGSLLGVGLLGAAVYWLVHVSGDWLWSFPALGLIFFTLLGIGTSGSETVLSRRVSVATAAVAAAAAVLLFAPPYLSARFTDQALRSDSPGDLAWSRRLDPLSTEPYVAEAELTRGAARTAALRRAVEKEPRRADLRYLLWRAELATGRRAEAAQALAAARRLDPHGRLLAGGGGP